MEATMSEHCSTESITQPTSLQEAINIIKFLNTTHKQEITRLKDAYNKQVELIKKLESNRKRELEFLSGELQKYEVNLALRSGAVAGQLAEKDEVIQKQLEQIDELTRQLNETKVTFSINIPEINILDSNSDSGVALDIEDIKPEEIKPDVKTTRKCSRRFGDTISFLRRVDFSPIKYKPREATKKKDDKKNKLQVPTNDKRTFGRRNSNDKSPSDDERHLNDDSIMSDSGIEPMVIRPNKVNDSMNNHFSDDGSEDTSEEIFDRVMTRSSIRRSVKANPKYKKINRCKSKLLEQVKVNIVD